MFNFKHLFERFRFYLRHSVNDLRVNRQRSIFGLLCIATGVAAVVGLLTLGTIIENTLTGSLQESNRSDLVIYPAELFEFDDLDDLDIREQVREDGILNDPDGEISMQGLNRIRQLINSRYSDAEFTYQIELPEISIESEDNSRTRTIYAVDPAVYPLNGTLEDADGRSLQDMLSAPGSIVLSSNLASELSVNVGDTVTISEAEEETFTVGGIIPASDSDSNPAILGSSLEYAFISEETRESTGLTSRNEIVRALFVAEDTAAVQQTLVDNYPYLQVQILEDESRIAGNIVINAPVIGQLINTYLENLNAQDNILNEVDGYITPDGVETVEAWLAENYPDVFEELTVQVSDEAFVPFVSKPGNAEQIAVLFTIEKDKYPLYGTVEDDDGTPLNEMIQDPTDVVISQNLADILEVNVGDEIQIAASSGTLFTVSGIVPTDTEGGVDNIFSALFGYVYLDLSATEFLELNPDISEDELPFSLLYVKLDNPTPDELNEVNEAILERFPYLGTRTTDDLRRLNEDISEGTTQLVSVIGLVSLLIGGIGIVNTMLVIVRRRTNEIAVLKTLGLEPNEITTLFLVEAMLMGFIGSLIGIPAGWGVAYIMKEFAETLFAQELIFRVAAGPALRGLAVGMIVTTIFGLMPTLAAGQVRPAMVLRPQDSIIPRTGRASGFAALLIVILSLSLVAQQLIGPLVDADDIRGFSSFAGVILGGILGISIAASGLFKFVTRGNAVLTGLRWVLVPFSGLILGYLFGYNVEALVLLVVVIIVSLILYIMLWGLIWLTGRGIPFIINLTPTVISRRLIDAKIAMRSMLATKGRGASTLLALVVGVFALSLLTMMVDAFRQIVDDLQIDAVGGNVIILTTGNSLNDVESKLTETTADGETRLADGVKSYAIVTSYDVESTKIYDASEDIVLSVEDLESRLNIVDDTDSWKPEALSNLFTRFDARSVDANLPRSDMEVGRQLNSNDGIPACQFISGNTGAPSDSLDGITLPPQQSAVNPACAELPPMVLNASEVTRDIGLTTGDQLIMQLVSGERITFEIVGVIDAPGIETFGATFYVPLSTFRNPIDNDFFAEPQSTSFVVDMDENKISDLRRRLSDISEERQERGETPGFVFMLETRLINDILTKIIDAFTLFPQVVAALALFTSGAVIANSVALSTMERRREIAIMKSIGMSRRRVLGMLIIENALMGVIGGLIGVGIGVIILFLLQEFVFNDLGDIIPYGTALWLMLLCVAIAVVAALFSVWNASSEKPLNVLRYE